MPFVCPRCDQLWLLPVAVLRKGLDAAHVTPPPYADEPIDLGAYLSRLFDGDKDKAVVCAVCALCAVL